MPPNYSSNPTYTPNVIGSSSQGPNYYLTGGGASVYAPQVTQQMKELSSQAGNKSLLKSLQQKSLQQKGFTKEQIALAQSLGRVQDLEFIGGVENPNTGSKFQSRNEYFSYLKNVKAQQAASQAAAQVAMEQETLAPSARGPDTFISSKGGYVQRVPASFQKVSPKLPVSSEGETRFVRVQKTPSPTLSSQERPEVLQKIKEQAEQDAKEDYTPLGRYLIKEKAVSRGITDLETKFLLGIETQIKREPERAGAYKFVKGAGEQNVFPLLKVAADPIQTGKGLGNVLAVAPGYFFRVDTVNGVPQIMTNTENVKKQGKKVLDFVQKNPEEAAGAVLGGALFDTVVTAPVLSFASRPVVNLVSRGENILNKVEVGVIKGTTEYNIITKGEKTILLEADIHTKTPKVKELGDLPLNRLVKVTKAQTGKETEAITFVGGALTDTKKGDTFLLRQIKEHGYGSRNAPFYASPEINIEKEIVFRSGSGETKVVPAGQKVLVGAKQFANNLQESGYAGVEFGLLKKKNVGVITKNAVERIEPSGNVLDFRREAFNPKYSGESTIQIENELLLSQERQRGFQAQGVKYFKSRGSTLTQPTDDVIKAKIFNVKELPFGLAKKNPALQELYEDIGFGRSYKSVEFVYGKVGVPPGRPPSLDFEGPPVYKRPAARAVVQNPLTGKYILVQEGKQKFIFPGGGVEPVLVPGYGKEGVRLAYPKDFSQTALRELNEETGMVGLSAKRIRGTITSEVKPLRPLAGPKGNKFAVFEFQDINTFYEVKAAPLYRPKGEITRIKEFTAEEAILSPNVGSVEKQFFLNRIKKTKTPKNVVVTASESVVKDLTSPSSESYYLNRKRVTLEDYRTVPRGIEEQLTGRRNKTEEFYEKKKKFSPGSYYFSRSEEPQKYLREIKEPLNEKSYSFSGGRKEQNYLPEEPIYPTRVVEPPFTPEYYPKYSARIVTYRTPPETRYPPYGPKYPPVTPPTTTSPPRKRDNFENALKRPAEKGFITILYKRGKPFKQLGGVFTRQEAIARGKINAGLGNLGRSFKVAPANQLATPKGIRDPVGEKFRFGKRDPSLFVEESASALSTKREVNQIQAARRLKMNKKMRFF